MFAASKTGAQSKANWMPFGVSRAGLDIEREDAGYCQAA
jgi:hypothetical protein